MFKSLDGNSFKVMQKSLDALWLRQQVISNNIANIDTPGYKSQYVEFEDLLKNQLDSAKADASGLNLTIEMPEAEILVKDQTSAREDGNNVDIDAENIELVRMQVQYEYVTRQLSEEFSRLRYAISEGRR